MVEWYFRGQETSIYYKSWPKGRIDSFVTAAESENVGLATITKGRIDILATVPRPHPLMRKWVTVVPTIYNTYSGWC